MARDTIHDQNETAKGSKTVTIAWATFNDFHLQSFKKKHDFENDTLKLLLTNGAPPATWTAISQATEITAEHGYAAGGITLTKTWSLVGAVGTLSVGSNVLTAAGGTIGPFSYAILYNSSAGTTNNLIAYADLRSLNMNNPITMLDTETLLFPAFQLLA